MATARKLGYDRKGLHVEAEGCIVNIYEGLTDRLGRNVTTIEILPDDHCSGEKVWRASGSHYTRVVELKTVKA